MKAGRRFSDEHRDGIFKLFALLAQQRGLRARRVQQRFLLGHIKARSDSAPVARVDQVQALLQGFHGAVEYPNFGIKLA